MTGRDKVNKKEKILVVDDEPDIRKVLAKILSVEGYRVSTANDANKALQKISEGIPDIIILDIMMSECDGMTLKAKLNDRESTAGIPIIFLTAKNGLQDKVAGLDIGADDYITKPFEASELLARIKAIIRRMNYIVYGAERKLQIDDLTVDFEKYQVYVDNKPVKLTIKEYDLLCLLLTKQGKPFSRDFLLNRVWGWESNSTFRTVDTHISSLRKKIGRSGRRIRSVRNVGYRFCKK